MEVGEVRILHIIPSKECAVPHWVRGSLGRDYRRKRIDYQGLNGEAVPTVAITLRTCQDARFNNGQVYVKAGGIQFSIPSDFAYRICDSYGREIERNPRLCVYCHRLVESKMLRTVRRRAQECYTCVCGHFWPVTERHCTEVKRDSKMRKIQPVKSGDDRQRGRGRVQTRGGYDYVDAR